MKKLFRLAAILAAIGLAFTFASCSNSSDNNAAILAAMAAGQSATYTITFNANDQSENPVTATQTFTAGTPQNLKTIASLGFAKDGFNFAGWLTASDATEARYADGAAYTATADATLYAKWTAVPVYSVNVATNENGTVTASPATAAAGTEITLSNTPNNGYQFASYTVTDADGAAVTVTDGKFTMPAKNVTVTATFSAINYNINIGTFANGSVSASPATATIGQTVTLTISPDSGYALESITVKDAGGSAVTLSGSGSTRTFKMPAKNVTVNATFSLIPTYTVTISANGLESIEASKTGGVAAGETVTITAKPLTGHELAALTVIAADGSSVAASGSGNTRTFTMPAQNVTVNAKIYLIASAEYNKDGTVTIGSTSYDIVTFGLWPQTIKAAGVTVDETVTQIHGSFTYCKGSDGAWYVKQAEKANGSDCKYSDGTTVGQGGTSEKWFKVQPIKWRVLTNSYGGAKLLLAESILTGGVPYYLNTDKRHIGAATYYPNKYRLSTIRAYLNGKYEEYDTQNKTYANKGFLQSAFTAAQQSAISDTTVDNSAESTTDAGGNIPQAEEYLVSAETYDKIFLLSEKEVTTSAYGFDVYNASGEGNARIRVTTDFAKATGADGWWWLRTPCYYSGSNARCVSDDGLADTWYDHYVDRDRGGVVPALCLEN